MSPAALRPRSGGRWWACAWWFGCRSTGPREAEVALGHWPSPPAPAAAAVGLWPGGRAEPLPGATVSLGAAWPGTTSQAHSVRVAGALSVALCREIRLSVRIVKPKLKCAMSCQLTKAYEFVLRTTKELLCFYQCHFGNRLCFFGNSDIAVVRQTHHEPDELWDAVLCCAFVC